MYHHSTSNRSVLSSRPSVNNRQIGKWSWQLYEYHTTRAKLMTDWNAVDHPKIKFKNSRAIHFECKNFMKYIHYLTNNRITSFHYSTYSIRFIYHFTPWETNYIFKLYIQSDVKFNADCMRLKYHCRNNSPTGITIIKR